MWVGLIPHFIAIIPGEMCITSLQSDAAMDIIVQNLGGNMTGRPRKATRLTVSLEEQDYRLLNEIAVARDASISWVIRQAIRQFIETTANPQNEQGPPRGGRASGRR